VEGVVDRLYRSFRYSGLLKEFKDKDTHKVTKWGYISLVGIVVSTILGVEAQRKENSSDAVKALAIAQQSETTLNEIHEITQKSDATLQEIQDVAQKSDVNLHEVQRSLTRLEDPNITAYFGVPCGDAIYKDYCDNLRANVANTPKDAPAWEKWPFEKPAFIRMEIFIYIDSKKADKLLSGSWEPPDLGIVLLSPSEGPDKATLSAFSSRTGEVQLVALEAKAVININAGTIKSTMDSPGAPAVIMQSGICPPNLVLNSFQINTKSSEMVGRAGPFEQITYNGMRTSRFVFPPRAQ
jgi:hypothetical protein